MIRRILTRTQAALPLLGLVMLVTASVACNFPTAATQGPQPPDDAPVASDDALRSVEEKLRALEETPSPINLGEFSVSFTEEELTSLAAEGISAVQTQDVTLSNVRVVLVPGQIHVYANVQVEMFSANGLVVAVPAVAADGTLDLTILSADFGMFSLDEALLADVTTAAENSLNAALTEQGSVQLTAITVEEDLLTVQGRLP